VLVVVELCVAVLTVEPVEPVFADECFDELPQPATAKAMVAAATADREMFLLTT
jgi:hypothetical protein